MAAVGEYFPQQFAAQVLQIANSVKAREAELAEMRSQRAARNFLDQQRVALAQQGRSLQAAQSGQGGGSSEYDEARAQAVREEAQQRREGLIAKSIAELQDKGFAYFGAGSEKAIADIIGAGTTPAGQDTVTRDGRKYTVTEGELEKPDPNKPRYHQMRVGNGIMLIRVGGKGSLEYQKHELENKQILEKIATENMRQQNYESLQRWRDARTKAIESGVGPGNGAAIANRVKVYTTMIEGRFANLIKAVNNPKANDEQRARAHEKLSAAYIDPTALLSKDEKTAYDNLQTAMQAAAAADAKAITTNRGLPKNPQINTEAIAGTGVEKDLTLSVLGHARKVNPSAPWEVLPRTYRENRRDFGVTDFYVDDTPGAGGYIPLNKGAWAYAASGKFKGRLSPLAKQYGWRPGAPSEPTAEPAATPAASPTAPTTAAADNATASLDVQINSLEEQLNKSKPGSPEEEAILSQINALIEQQETTTP